MNARIRKTLIIISAVVILLALVAILVLGIMKNYAKNHYDYTAVYTSGTDYMGCRKVECKYCNGIRVEFYWGKDYTEFVYYSTLNLLQIISIVLCGISAIVLVVLAVKKNKEKTGNQTIEHNNQGSNAKEKV